MINTNSTPNDTQTIIITDRNTEAEIGRTSIQLTPDMDELATYRAAHIALTQWGEENGRIFNELNWHWQHPDSNKVSTV